MTLFSRIKSDNQRILTEDMDDLTLYNAAGESHTGKGRWTNIGLGFTPQGQPIVSKKWSVGFHIDEFSAIADSANYKTWEGEFVDNQGNTRRGVLNNPFVDYTFGYVSATLTDKK